MRLAAASYAPCPIVDNSRGILYCQSLPSGALGNMGIESLEERLRMSFDGQKVDWAQCPAVERQPGRCSGAVTLLKSRMTLSTLFANIGNSGLDGLCYMYGLTEEQRQQFEDVLQFLQDSCAPEPAVHAAACHSAEVSRGNEKHATHSAVYELLNEFSEAQLDDIRRLLKAYQDGRIVMSSLPNPSADREPDETPAAGSEDWPTDAEMQEGRQRYLITQRTHAVSMRYDRNEDAFVLRMRAGGRLSVPRVLLHEVEGRWQRRA